MFKAKIGFWSCGRKRLRKLAAPCDTKQLCGVGNKVLCPLGLCTVRVQVSEYVVPVTFVVLSLCSHDLILGLDFLREHGALISCRTRELAISPFPAVDYWDSAETQNMSGNLSVRCTTTIPPLTGVWLAVKSSESETSLASVGILTEIKQNVLLQKSVASPTSLVTLKHGETFVWVVNFSYQACVTPAGLVVASFSVVPSFENMFPLSDDLVVTGLSGPSQSLDCQFEEIIDVDLKETGWKFWKSFVYIAAYLISKSRIRLEHCMFSMLSTLNSTR